MKLNKTLILVLSLSIVALAVALPEYESPTVYRKTASFDQPYNPRIDNLNDSSANNYARYKGGQLKNKVNRDLGRNFDLVALGKWMDFYENENMDEMPFKAVIDNLTNIIGKSVLIQNYIHFKSSMINKKLALLDMKLKQIDILSQTIDNIKNHPGDVSTNLGNNLLWKDSVNNLIRNAAVANSLYSIAANGMCNVLALKDRVHTPAMDSGLVEKSHYRNQYSPKSTLEWDNVTDEQPKPNFEEIDKSIPLRNKEDLKKGLAALAEEKKGKEGDKDTKKERTEELNDEMEDLEDTSFVEKKSHKKHRAKRSASRKYRRGH